MDACASGLWGQLNDRERREVLAWEAIAVRLDAASDKALEVVRITQDYAGVVRGLSRGTIYRKVAAYREQGVAGVLGAGALRRLGQRGGSALPAAFVAYWRARCAGMQREKVLPVWHALMRELCSGAVVPGYDCDWRGIWLLEHPGATVPASCPYRVDHRAARHPRGWSYRNLKALAPERDVMVGVTRGVAALRAFLPSVPHTRVGLGLMRVVTMDDVWHDVEVLFLHGRKRPEHERPVEVGVMDVLTGCHVCWNLWPVLRREDGSRRMVDKTIQRFIQATILCAIGVHPEGVIELLEHGTAGMDELEVKRLNGILGRYKLPPAQGAWVSVQRSSTTGAPLLQGLFVERACGNPRHKAMLESSWNLLHNALACLPAATGKDRDHAPADAEGLRRADRALMTAVNAVAKANPAALELLRQAEYHAVSFLRFKEVLEGVKREINHRVDHTLEGWEQCGFVRHVATLPGGSELDLDAVEPAQMEATAALVRQLNAPVRLRRLSPMEAFQMAAARMQLVRFPVACSVSEFLEELCEVCGLPGKLRNLERKRRLMNLLNDRSLLIVDELHELVISCTRSSALKICEVLREIYDRSHCGMVLCGTDTLRVDLLGGANAAWLDQLVQRSISVSLPRQLSEQDIVLTAAHYGMLGDLTNEARSTLKGMRMNILCLLLASARDLAIKTEKNLTWALFCQTKQALLG